MEVLEMYENYQAGGLAKKSLDKFIEDVEFDLKEKLGRHATVTIEEFSYKIKRGLVEDSVSISITIEDEDEDDKYCFEFTTHSTALIFKRDLVENISDLVMYYENKTDDNFYNIHESEYIDRKEFKDIYSLYKYIDQVARTGKIEFSNIIEY